ncbi:MAG: PilZ domain-containing protein [Spirochaetales bacterium]
MNAQTDWKDKFSAGFASPGVPLDLGPVLGFLAVLAILGGLAYLYIQWQRNRAVTGERSDDEEITASKKSKYVPIPGRINPLQQKVIQDMIDEFRKQEVTAQSIPSNVLEKYSEFFFKNLDRLKTEDKAVEEFVDGHYPILPDMDCELDFRSSGVLYLVKTKVLAIDSKSVIVEFNSQIPDFVRRGLKLYLNYNQNKHFVQGATLVTDVKPNQGIILRRPTQVIVTSERRYSRITLPKASGSLHDTKSTYQATVRVLDLSLEGVRIQVGRPLEKNHIYQLVFEANDGTKNHSFGPIECVPSKAFLTGSGTYETGLAFVYVSFETKTQIWNFMKTLSQQATAVRTDS